MSNTEKANMVIMDFSGIYREEQFWKEAESIWADVSDISGTNCYCDVDAMAQLMERTADFSVGGMHFIDSGNYHYMSRIWLEKAKEPFMLLVFDNHTDMQPPAFGGLLSCGGWILAALEELPLLKEVVLVGPDEEAFSQVEEEFAQRVRFLSREKLQKFREAVEPIKAAEVTKGANEAKFLQEGDGGDGFSGFFREIPTDLPLYISVDKDILNKKDACTTWSQGDMSLFELMQALLVTKERFEENEGRLLGVDICGECDPEAAADNMCNDRTNRVLAEFFAGWLS